MKKILSILTIAGLLIGSVYADNKVENKNNKKSNVSTSSIKGIVLDKHTGEALAGVKIIIEELDQAVYTDLDGQFEFSNIVKDTYHVDAEMISYEKRNRTIDLYATDDLKIEMENK